MRVLCIGVISFSAKALGSVDVLRRVENADMIAGVVRVQAALIDDDLVKLGSILANDAAAELGICCLCPIEPVVAANCVSADVRYLKAGVLVRSEETGVVVQERAQI
jgi:hypothetical protein